MQRYHARHLLAGGVSVALLPVCGSVTADDDVNYTFAELAAIKRDVDVFDDQADTIEDWDDGGGYAFRGSVAFTDNFFLFGGYSNTESDVTYVSNDVFLIPAEEDTKRLDVGIGLKGDLGEKTDLVGRVGYTDIDFGDFEIGGDTTDDNLTDTLRGLDEDETDGYFVDVGVRSQLLDNLEGGIGVRYTNIEDIDDTSLIASLAFELSDRWGISAEIDAGDEVSQFALGGRFRWEP